MKKTGIKRDTIDKFYTKLFEVSTYKENFIYEMLHGGYLKQYRDQYTFVLGNLDELKKKNRVV